MQSTHTNEIVDLCSGGAGPWIHLADISRVLGRDDEARIFTDKAQTLYGSESISKMPPMDVPSLHATPHAGHVQRHQAYYP